MGKSATIALWIIAGVLIATVGLPFALEVLSYVDDEARRGLVLLLGLLFGLAALVWASNKIGEARARRQASRRLE